jgi:hypothetical protein
LNVQDPSQGPDQFFGYEISLNGSQVVVGRHNDGFESLASFPCNTPTDQWVTLSVQFQEDSFQISVNGTLVGTYTDQQYPLGPGMIGLRCFGGSASFQQLSVTSGTTTTQVQFVPAGPSNAVSDMWTATQQGSATGSYTLVTSGQFVGSQSQQMTFTTGSGALGVFNQGLNRWGLNFVKNSTYNGLVWVEGQPGTSLYVSAESADGFQLYSETELQVTQAGWQKLAFTLRPSQSDQNSRFAIRLKSPGSVTLGYIPGAGQLGTIQEFARKGRRSQRTSATGDPRSSLWRIYDQCGSISLETNDWFPGSTATLRWYLVPLLFQWMGHIRFSEFLRTGRVPRYTCSE